MKTIYAILYVNLNTALQERISIGIVMTNGEDYFFSYSQSKLQMIKSLLGNEKYTLARRYFKSLSKEFKAKKTELLPMFTSIEVKGNWVNESYLSYLSKYGNNIVLFSEPKVIDIECTQENFKRIFEKYIYTLEAEEQVEEQVSIQQTVREELYPEIKDNVNLDRLLTPEDFKKLIVPTSVDIIGNNGVPMLAQTLDFTKKGHYLGNDITHYMSVIMAIKSEKAGKGKFFAIGKEPLQGSEAHLMWKGIHDSDFVDFVDVDEMELITDYIQKYGVEPYFQT